MCSYCHKPIDLRWVFCDEVCPECRGRMHWHMPGDDNSPVCTPPYSQEDE